MRVAIKAIYELFTEIKKEGTQKQFLDRMWTRKELYELLDYKGMLEREGQFSGEIYDI